ncbi:hypothetical protein BDR26DRAFT_866483 [Obelidium mucronatum]|nr:hypothetical protein BDR26DRAFT_866483 [Obelidium mucronatum]
MGFGGAPAPAPFMFGGMGAATASGSFNPGMMNMNMNMGMNTGMNMGMNFNTPGGFMGMMGAGNMMMGGGGQPLMMQNPMMPVLPTVQRQSSQMNEDDYDD